MSDTFFTASPHWTWLIIPYFFVGWLAGGAYSLAGDPRMVSGFDPKTVRFMRTAYSLAFWEAIISGALLKPSTSAPLPLSGTCVSVPTTCHTSCSKPFSPILVRRLGDSFVRPVRGALADRRPGRRGARVRPPLRRGPLPEANDARQKLIPPDSAGLMGFFPPDTRAFLRRHEPPDLGDSPWLARCSWLSEHRPPAARTHPPRAAARGDRGLDCLAGSFDIAGGSGRAAHLILFVAWLWPIRPKWG